MNEIKLVLNLKEGLFTLNEGTLNALGRPRQVQLLINVKKIRQQMGWEDEMTRECTGNYFPMHQAVSFDLSRVRITNTMIRR